ncbi:MAG: HAD hydrolase-like protein [Candidatus Omnitrophica bacterium]|nr:HAD hydrolase-like protein [Candidatus Omnitrophota bacterium]
MKKPIFIFDFDGTIADTHHYIVKISNDLCEEFNYDPIQWDELHKLKNMTSQEVMRHLKVPILKIPAILTKARKEFKKNIKSLSPFKGIKESLHKLQDKGNSIGILSSNSAENISEFLNNHDLNTFDFVYTTSSVWGKNKSLKKLINKHDFHSQNIFYIGDETRDIVAAKKLNIKSIAVTWGYNSAEALKKYSPDFMVNAPEELLDIANRC